MMTNAEVIFLILQRRVKDRLKESLMSLIQHSIERQKISFLAKLRNKHLKREALSRLKKNALKK